MMVRGRVGVLLIAAACLGSLLTACSSDKPKAGGLDDSCTDCGATDGGKTKDAGIDVKAEADASDSADADAPETEPYTGPTADVSGTVFAMFSPKFDTSANTGSKTLRPAMVRIAAYGKEYAGRYTPDEGFNIKDVPQGEFPVLVSDIDAGNAILDTATTARVLDAGNYWELPTTTRPSLVVVYGSLAPQLVIDGYRGQAIVSFENPATEGSARIPGVRVNAPTDSEGAIYYTAQGWIHESASGTASDGTAIIANIPAEPFPGKVITFSYILEGKTYENVELRVVRGAVTRLRVVHGC